MVIITGTGRCGTLTAARIFGFSHEYLFSPLTLEKSAEVVISQLPYAGGEVSWMAAPFVKDFGPCHKVIHLVRHPMGVINSLEAIDPWSFDGWWMSKYARFKDKYLPELVHLKNRLEKFMYVYIHWNNFVEGYPRIRVEDLRNAPTMNAKKRGSLSWKDLPDGTIKRGLATVSSNYGYDYEHYNPHTVL